MVPRSSADAFSMDVYGACLNGEAETHAEDRDRKPWRSTGHDSNRLEQSDRVAAETSAPLRPGRQLRYVLPRLIWLAIGPGALMMLAILKLEKRSGASETLDAAFYTLTAVILLLRWVTWIAGDRWDSFGARMSFSRLLGFSALLLTAVGSVWSLATLIAEQL